MGPAKVGWGHSTFRQAVDFATLAEVGAMVTFHHDPAHNDVMLDAVAEDIKRWNLPFDFVPGKTGTSFDL